MDLRTDILPHRDRLYRLALGITLNTAEAEDVVQDTMLRVWEHRNEWSSIDDIEAWLVQICRRLAIDKRRKNTPGLTIDAISGTASSIPEPPSSPSYSPSVAVETNEVVSHLTNIIEQLPPPQPEIVRLREIEGLAYRDIALCLNLSENQIRVYLHRARQRIRKEYQALFGI